jgi:hypothetical protein
LRARRLRLTDHVPDLVKRLYEIVYELEERFPERHFTPDGHLVDSLGEVLAVHRYNLDLLTASTERHDTRTRSRYSRPDQGHTKKVAGSTEQTRPSDSDGAEA